LIPEENSDENSRPLDVYYIRYNDIHRNSCFQIYLLKCPQNWRTRWRIFPELMNWP